MRVDFCTPVAGGWPERLSGCSMGGGYHAPANPYPVASLNIN
jgi:hypothetical protein